MFNFAKKWWAKRPPLAPPLPGSDAYAYKWTQQSTEAKNTCRLCGWRRKSSSMKAISDGAADDIGRFWFLKGFFFFKKFPSPQLIVFHE